MKYILVYLVTCVFVLWPRTATSCSCDAPLLSPRLFEHSTVFAGRVKHIKTLEDGTGDRVVFFDVTDVWSGNVEQRTLVVTAPDLVCGYEFAIEQSYIVVAETGELYRFRTGMCHGTRQLDQVEDVYGILGEPVTRFDSDTSPWKRWNEERGLSN